MARALRRGKTCDSAVSAVDFIFDLHVVSSVTLRMLPQHSSIVQKAKKARATSREHSCQRLGHSFFLGPVLLDSAAVFKNSSDITDVICLICSVPASIGEDLHAFFAAKDSSDSFGK